MGSELKDPGQGTEGSASRYYFWPGRESRLIGARIRMNDYTSLDVWKESVALAKAVYELTAKFPAGERYGLTSQMRRAAVSVASNIAEGAGRNSNADFCRFLDMASGSVSELHTQFVIATEVRLLPALRAVSEDCPAEDLTERMTRIRKMLAGLRRSLKG